MRTKKGFTLIELLVVIAIIGILAAMVMVALTGARAKARDARRKSELRSIRAALELYYNDNEKYVGYLGNTWGTALIITGTDALSTALKPTYMKTVPVDPKNADPYLYKYGADNATNATTFTLFTTLENKNDPEGNAGAAGGYTVTAGQ